jgi:heme/copper-type cytochrome/quinol oxidase subunit 2
MEATMDIMKPHDSGGAFRWMAMGSFLTLLMLKLYGIADIDRRCVFMSLIIYGVLLAMTGILVLTMITILWRHRRDNGKHDEK